MKVIGNQKPYMSNNLGGVEPEPETCDHTADGKQFDPQHHAFVVSTCEKCGAPLRAKKINEQLLKETGELEVTEWVFDIDAT